MFDEVPAGSPKPVEDIFASSAEAKSVNPIKPVVAGPGSPDTNLEFTSRFEAESSWHRFLPWIGVGVVALALAGGAYWWFGVRGTSPTTPESTPAQVETPTPEPARPVTPAVVLPPDQDGDGLTDSDENTKGTNPNSSDTDGDGLFDGEEVNVWHTDPLRADTDGDTYSDGEEVKNGFNPNGEGKLLPRIPQP